MLISFLRGIGRYFRARFRRTEIRFVCLAVLGISLLLLLVSFVTSRGNRTGFGNTLGGDFAGFYAAGTLLNRYDRARLYDFELQDTLYHDLSPGVTAAEKLPYVYPPFFSLLFRPLALLPYPWAYLVWLLASVGLVIGGVALLRRMLPSIPKTEWSTIYLLLLSFEPLALECWQGGQTSAIGFFLIGAAIYLDWRRLPLAAGAVLALCLYKPPLLFLLLPMLVVGRQGRLLGGFLLGVLGVSLLSVVAVGWQGCIEYARVVTGFTRLTNSGQEGFPLWKFVDLGSFLKLILGGASPLVWPLVIALVLAVLPFLVSAWLQFSGSRSLPPKEVQTPESNEPVPLFAECYQEAHRHLVWAMTITWTLVLNVYIGIYDAIMVIPALLLTANFLFGRAGGSNAALPAPFKALLILLYILPWFSEHLAMAARFQPFTLGLAGLATYQLILARSVRHMNYPSLSEEANVSPNLTVPS